MNTPRVHHTSALLHVLMIKSSIVLKVKVFGWVSKKLGEKITSYCQLYKITKNCRNGIVVKCALCNIPFLWNTLYLYCSLARFLCRCCCSKYDYYDSTHFFSFSFGCQTNTRMDRLLLLFFSAKFIARVLFLVQVSKLLEISNTNYTYETGFIYCLIILK